MEVNLLYKNQKQYHFLDRRLDAMKKVAIRSRHRTLSWGTIAALAWIGGVATLTPIQRARSIWPHLTMMVAAVSIAATVRNFHQTACQAEKETKDLIKELKACRRHDDILRVMVKDDELEKKYKRFALMADEVQDREYY